MLYPIVIEGLTKSILLTLLPHRSEVYEEARLKSLGGIGTAMECKCRAMSEAGRPLNAVAKIFDPHLKANSNLNHFPIHFGVKELIDIAGVITGNGNPNCLRENSPAKNNAKIVDLLLNAGAQLAATTTMLEYAAGSQHPDFPECRSPQNLKLTAGGSSSGSAALVGAKILDLTVGSDTGGSIRIPAAYCAAIGFKPSYGAIDITGVTPLAPSIDHLGFFTANLKILDQTNAITIPNYLNNSESNSLTLNIAIPWRWVNDKRNDISIKKSFTHLVNALSDSGINVVDLEVKDLEEIRSTFMSIVLYEAWQIYGAKVERNPKHFGAETYRLFCAGKHISRWQYENALQTRSNLLPLINQIFENFDLALMPAVPYLPPETTPPLDSPLGAYEGLYTEIFNLTGQPALVGPAPFLPEFNLAQMKYGIQLVGRFQQDHKLIGDTERLKKFFNWE